MVSGSAYMHMFSSTQPVYAMLDAFNPFPFKVIVNMCDPITIFLFVLCLFFVSLFLLLCFLPREVPSEFVVELSPAYFYNLFTQLTSILTWPALIIHKHSITFYIQLVCPPFFSPSRKKSSYLLSFPLIKYNSIPHIFFI